MCAPWMPYRATSVPKTRARQRKFRGTPRPPLRLGSRAGSDAAVSHAAPGQPAVLFARPTQERIASIPAWLVGGARHMGNAKLHFARTVPAAPPRRKRESLAGRSSDDRLLTSSRSSFFLAEPLCVRCDTPSVLANYFIARSAGHKTFARLDGCVYFFADHELSFPPRLPAAQHQF